jgi:ferredoxin
VRVRVDADKCTGHARCNANGPDVYQLDDMGYCRIDVAEVPPALEEQARSGAASCPERAITVEE